MLFRVFGVYVDPEYLLYSIYDPNFQERMARNAVGLTVKHLRVGDVEKLVHNGVNKPMFGSLGYTGANQCQ